MKTSELVPTDKSIVLGIYDTDTYAQIWRKQNFCGYVDFNRWKMTEECVGIMDVVLLACIHSDKIVFILDNIQFPINPSKSVTCNELLLICSNDELFDKTIFVKGENVVNFDKNLVL